jgi:hypothetical protein
MGPLIFLIYVKYLPRIAAKDTKIILDAHSTSITATNPNPDGLKIAPNKTFCDINMSFKTNLLSQNFN